MSASAIRTDDGAEAARGDGRRSPQRRCIATRESGPREGLIRFAISPDGEVVPDLGERLPGRGLWLSARRDIVHRACTENLFSKAARRKVSVPADLPDRLTDLLDRRCLDMIGLARRSGQAVTGFEKVRAAAKGGTVALLLEASDGALDGREKLERILPGSEVLSLWTAAALGVPFGRDRAVHVAILEGGFAGRLKREAARLQGMRYEGASDGAPMVLQES